MTDADVYMFPEMELSVLRKRNIVPYIIYIANPLANGVKPTLPEFASRIGEYGGKFFDVRDSNSLRKAYEEIDKIEKAETRIKRYALRTDLFQPFLSITIPVIFFLIMLGTLIELIWLRHP